MDPENREAFFQRLKPYFTPREMCNIQLAYTLAKFSHRAQVRKDEKNEDGEPIRYFEHLRRVALILIDEVRLVDRSMVTAALLHDGIEDTRDLTPEMIECTFGDDVGRLVQLLSKVPKEGYLERLRLANDYRVLVIKGCDRLDNIRSLTDSPREFQAKQVTETREKYYPLFDHMVEVTPNGYRIRVQGLRDKVLKATERQAGILGI